MSKNIEIEKKYLVINGVNSIGGNLILSDPTKDYFKDENYLGNIFISQGYLKPKDLSNVNLSDKDIPIELLTGKEGTIRFRKENDLNILTFKGERVNGANSEYEFRIEEDLSNKLNKVLTKTRYKITKNQFICEIDVFHGDLDGLVLAEIEIDNINRVIEVPDTWIDVTNNKNFLNSNLIKLNELHAKALGLSLHSLSEFLRC